jgi:hypothetical protein
VSGDRPAVSDRVILEEGEDYSLTDGIPALTKAGFQRMAAAHAIGRESVIIADDVVIIRYPAEQEPPRPFREA